MTGDLLTLFNPYITFISFFVTISLNIALVFKSNLSWYSILLLNVIISVTFNFLGLESYDLITQLLIMFGEFIISAFEPIIDLFTGFFDSISIF